MKRSLTKTYIGAQKKRRRARRTRRYLIVGISFVLLVGVVYVYLTRSSWELNDIKISGLVRTSEDDVQQVVSLWLAEHDYYILPHSSVWFARSGELEGRILAALPTIKVAKASKEYPHTLKILVEEYDGWGVICRGEGTECYWIDRAGVSFDLAPEFTGLIVPKVRDMREREFKLGASQLTQAMMHLITYFNERAAANDHLQSLQFTIDQKDATLRVRTRGGWEILLLETNSPEESFKNLALALDGEIKGKIPQLEYIDLRFGNRIFYKFKD
jgi:cell division septal protein FtsQ